MKNRPQITISEVIKFLQACPGNLPVFCSKSDSDEEEPYEFIHDEEKKPCVAIEITGIRPDEKYATFGYANEGSSNQPLCILTNDEFSWLLVVDGQTINFDGAYIAEYFARHYEKLGYDVKWEEEGVHETH